MTQPLSGAPEQRQRMQVGCRTLLVWPLKVASLGGSWDLVLPTSHVRLPPFAKMGKPFATQLRGFRFRSRQPGKGAAFPEGQDPLRLNSPCDLLAKPRFLGVCVSRTSTFQGQLFHHRFASTGSYAPTARCLPVQAPGVRALRPFPHSTIRLHGAHQKGSSAGW
jgi:hypothetical protein